MKQIYETKSNKLRHSIFLVLFSKESRFHSRRQAFRKSCYSWRRTRFYWYRWNWKVRFYASFLWQNVVILPTYIIHKTFWFKDFSNTRNIRTYCFRYFQLYFDTFAPKSEKKKDLTIHKDFWTISRVTKISLLA